MAANLSASNLSLIILAEITASLCPRNWVLTSGKTITYQVSTSETITAVKFDRDTTLTERSTVNDVESNAGSWALLSGILYVSAPTGETPFTGTVCATCSFWLSNKAKTYSARWYDPRIKSVPALSLRIESRFGGVGQVGGGDMRLVNLDGHFDSRSTLQWDNGTVTIKVGSDTKSTTAAYPDDFSTVGTWSVEDWGQSDTDFVLKLKELKNKLKKSIPLEYYADGKTPKQRAYGRIKGAKPVMVAPLTFQVAGHEIHSFDGLRCKIEDIWTTIPFETRDTSTAQFTILDAYKDKELSVDFSGKENADGTLMLNGISMIQDLLSYVGETNIDTTSFTAAKSKLVLGADLYGREVVVRSPALYIDKGTDALRVIGEINEIVGSYLYNDNEGTFYVAVERPERGESLTEYGSGEILDGTLSSEDDNKDLLSEIKVTFDEFLQEKQTQAETVESERSEFIHGEKSAMIEAITVRLSERDHARYWAQKRLFTRSKAIKRWSFQIPWIGLLVMPGTHLRLTYDRSNMDEVVEVLEVRTDLMTGKVSLVVGDCRGFKDSPGFWVSTSNTLPTRFSNLTGYSSGSLTWNASWDAEIRTWARQNVGYWTNANGFATVSDSESQNASVWV